VSRIHLFLALVALSISSASSADEPRPGEARILSPSDGSIVRVSSVPLFVRLRGPFLGSTVRVMLDGRDVTDPLGVFSTRAASSGAGSYLATLDLDGVAPGAHELEVRFSIREGQRSVVGRSKLTWEPPPCRLDLEVVDEKGRPSSARVMFRTSGAPYVLVGPDADAACFKGQDARLDSVFVVGGSGRVFLDPAEYTAIAVRGVRHELAVLRVNLGPDCPATTTLRFRVPEVVATPDHVTADLHVHTGRSPDSFVPDRERYRSLIAADLDVAVITDHNLVTDPSVALEQVRVNGAGTRGIAGVEARIGPRRNENDRRTHSIGHANFFPLVAGKTLPSTESSDPGELLRAYRAHSADDLLSQLNHPRGLSRNPWDRRATTTAHAVFNSLGFDRRRLLSDSDPRLTRSLDYDVLELLNRFSWGTYLQVRADWFLLMNLGHFLTGTGNSDSHALSVELAGFPVNLVRTRALVANDGSATAGFLDAVRDGRVSVSTGPVVTLSVRTASGRTGLPGDTLRSSEGRVTASVEIRAAGWVPVREVRLIVNGEEVRSETLTGELKAAGRTFEWSVELERDSWILAEAGWPAEDTEGPGPDDLGRYAWVVPGHVPLAFTNPVRIDVGADGVWTPFEPEAAAARAAPMPSGSLDVAESP
jgi:hypothetical protein